MKLTTSIFIAAAILVSMSACLAIEARAQTNRPTPNDTMRPLNGAELVYHDASFVTGPHQIIVQNNSGYDAIVKVEDLSVKEAYRLAFVRKDETATLEKIKDGTYQLKFTLGSDYSPELRRFFNPVSFTRFDDPNTFVTTIEKTATETITHYLQLTITLGPTPEGRAKTSQINEKEF